MNVTFDSFVGVSPLQPLSETQAAEYDAYLQNVRDNVVPRIVSQVVEREKRAAEARKMFVR